MHATLPPSRVKTTWPPIVPATDSGDGIVPESVARAICTRVASAAGVPADPSSSAEPLTVPVTTTACRSGMAVPFSNRSVSVPFACSGSATQAGPSGRTVTARTTDGNAVSNSLDPHCRPMIDSRYCPAWKGSGSDGDPGLDPPHPAARRTTSATTRLSTRSIPAAAVRVAAPAERRPARARASAAARTAAPAGCGCSARSSGLPAAARRSRTSR